MPARGKPLNDPALAKAFGEGFAEGLAEIYGGAEPEWKVEVRFEGTLIKAYQQDDLRSILADVAERLKDGCAVTITPVDPVESTPGEISEPKDDEIVDAEIID